MAAGQVVPMPTRTQGKAYPMLSRTQINLYPIPARTQVIKLKLGPHWSIRQIRTGEVSCMPYVA